MLLLPNRRFNSPGKFTIFFGLLVSLLCCQSALSESVEQLQTQIKHLKSAQAQLQSDIASQKSRQVKYQQELERAKTQLARLEKQLQDAFEKVKASPTELSQRNATKLSITYNRELDKASRLTKRVQGRRNKLSQLEQALAMNQTQQYQLRKMILREEKRIEAARALVTSETPTIAVPQPVAAIAATAPPEWPHLNLGSEADKAFARQAVKAAKETGGTPIFRRVQIGAKMFGKQTMDYLGASLYSYSGKVVAGHHSFTVFENVYWLQIPEEDAGQLYRFIFDASSLSSPQLRIFRESVLAP